jgi:hypothetical protein
MPRIRPRPRENWKQFARRLYDAERQNKTDFSLRTITALVNHHFGLQMSRYKVLYWINPEYRRDKIRSQRLQRSRMSEQERQEENTARKYRDRNKGAS